MSAVVIPGQRDAQPLCHGTDLPLQPVSWNQRRPVSRLEDLAIGITLPRLLESSDQLQRQRQLAVGPLCLGRVYLAAVDAPFDVQDITINVRPSQPARLSDSQTRGAERQPQGRVGFGQSLSHRPYLLGRQTFPDNHLINHPYKVEIAQGECTCTVADFTGTMRGPIKGSGGKVIAPTNKKFHIDFCTVAHWKKGEIVEEKLFYDLVGLLKQIGVM